MTMFLTRAPFIFQMEKPPWLWRKRVFEGAALGALAKDTFLEDWRVCSGGQVASLQQSHCQDHWILRGPAPSSCPRTLAASVGLWHTLSNETHTWMCKSQ